MTIEDQPDKTCFVSLRGKVLFGQWWHGVISPKALLVLVHGLGGHVGRYGEFAKKGAESGLAVFGFDLRGHGRSSGKRGHTGSMEELVVNLQQAMMQARLVYADVPMFLFGHGLGANVVANYLIRIKSKEVSGAILSSPWFELSMDIMSSKGRLSRLMNSAWPSFTRHNSIDPQDLSHVASEVVDYIGDPLVHDRISVRMHHSIVEAGKFAVSQAGRLAVPVLVCHGTDDSIISLTALSRFMENAGELANSHPWEGARHDPLHDVGKENVMDFYLHWIFEHLPA